MKNLIEKVKQWGLDRDIVYTGKDGQDKLEMMEAQARYTLKEVNEISDAYANDSLEEFIDGIGDTLVTMLVGSASDERISSCFEVMVCNLNDNPHACLEKKDFKDLYVNLWSSAYSLIHVKPHESEYQLVLHDLDRVLNYVNSQYGPKHTLKDCLTHAYNEIKDRKGKVVNGQFIKEE